MILFGLGQAASLKQERDAAIRERDALRMKVAELQAALRVYESKPRSPFISTWPAGDAEVEYRTAVPEVV